MSWAWSLPTVLVLGWAAMAPGQLSGTASQLLGGEGGCLVPLLPLLPGFLHWPTLCADSQACVCWGRKPGRASLPSLHPTCLVGFSKRGLGQPWRVGLCCRVTHYLTLHMLSRYKAGAS